MSNLSCQKQVIHWNTITFQHLHSIVNLINTHQQKEKPQEYDFKLRDFYFQPNFTIFGSKIKKTFIEQSSNVISNFIAFNQLGYLQSVSFEHQLQKHRFWNKIYKMYIKNKQDHQAKQIVRNIVWTYRLVPVTLFVFGGATILRMSGIYKMSIKKQMVGLIAAAFTGDFFIRAKKSSQIFYLIPPLSNPQLEEERLNIVNKSIVLDGKINEIQIQPSYVSELIEQAEKETNAEECKKILQTAGYKVVDRVDYEYQ